MVNNPLYLPARALVDRIRALQADFRLPQTPQYNAELEALEVLLRPAPEPEDAQLDLTLEEHIAKGGSPEC